MSKILTLRMTDYYDACGTNGGIAFVEIDALYDGKEVSSFRFEAHIDKGKETLISNGEPCISPPFFQTHMHLAASAWVAVLDKFTELSDKEVIEGYYSEVFMQNDIDAPYWELTWDIETNTMTYSSSNI